MSHPRTIGPIDSRVLPPVWMPVCDIRVRASVGVTKNGSNVVSAILNTGNLGGSFVQGAQALWVDNIAAGKPVIRFRGYNDNLIYNLNSAPYQGGGTFAIAFIPRATEQAGVLEWSGALNDGSTTRFIQRDSGNVRFYLAGVNPDSYVYTIAHPNDELRVYLLTWSTDHSQLWVNSVAQAPAGGQTPPFSSATIFLGSGYPYYGHNDIAEFRLYNHIMTNAEAVTESQFMMRDYGL